MRVIILDDDEMLRSVLRDYFEYSGQFQVSAFSSLAELQGALTILGQFSAAILDVNLGPGEPTGIDAYHWLRERGFQGQVIFLTGHARSHPIVRSAIEIRDALLFEKPTDIEALERAIVKREAA